MRQLRDGGHESLRREIVDLAETIAGLARNRNECPGYLIPLIRDLELKMVQLATSPAWQEACPRCCGRGCAALDIPREDAPPAS